MRRRLAVAPVLKGASVAAALTAGSVAQAASVETVFSAENALYGAGYSIGQADGWIDDDLRAAVRQYQMERPGLNATGELDSQTLAALGVAGKSSQLMGGNGVASREAAREQLGLSVAFVAKPAPTPEPEKPAAMPEPAIEPEPEFVVAEVSTPAPQPKIDKSPEPVKKAAPKAESQAEPKTPEVAEKPDPQPQVVKAQPVPTPSHTRTEPEPSSEPIRIAAAVRVSNDAGNAPVIAKKRDLAFEQDEAVKVASAKSVQDVEPALPTEPTAAPVDQQAASSNAKQKAQPAERQGNVLTKMFDFLFGWMV